VNFPILILCGGRANRLKTISKDIPKSLMPVNGKPFLYHLLKSIEKYGSRKVILCTGYLSGKIENFLENHTFNLQIEISNESIPLGTGGAVKKAIDGFKTPFFVTYGDSYLDFQLDLLQRNYQNKKMSLMVIFKNDQRFDTSNVVLNGEKIIYCKSKLLTNANYIDYGLSLLKPKAFNEYPEKFDLAVLLENLSKNGNLDHVIINKRFYEIGTPESYAEFVKFFEEKGND